MIAAHRVDVFVGGQHRGNPAAVVLAADDLNDITMQSVARKLAVSDTAFVSGDAPTYRLRWFTPACEISLCGHATIAAAHVLDSLEPVRFAYAGGELTVHSESLGGETLYWLARPAPQLTEWHDDPAPLLAALGGPSRDPELPPALTAESDLLLPLANAGVVEGLRPDHTLLAAACRELDLRGLAVVAFPSVGAYEVRSRFFAPHLGIDEDPATGSVHGAIAVYLYLCDLLEHHPHELRAIGLQGDPRGRCGEIWMRLTLRGDEPNVVEVGGRAHTVGQVSLPAPQDRA